MAQSRFYSATAQPTVLTAGITPTTTVINVQQTIGFPPTTPYILALDYNSPSEEIVLVTNAAGTSLTVTRAYDGTSATSHDAGAAVRHTWTAMDGNNSRAHEGSTSGVHGVTGNVVGTTDTQTLTNKTLTAAILNNPTIIGAVSLSSPTITGTVAGSATYTNVTLSTPGITNPTITGTVGGPATYNNASLVSPAITGTVTGAALYNNITVITPNAGATALMVRAAASQTANILRIEDSTSALLARVDSGGIIHALSGLRAGSTDQFSVATNGDVTTTGKFTNLTLIESESTTSSTTASTTFTNLASGAFNASITVPPSGKVLVTIHASFRNSAATNSLTSFDATGSTSGAVYTANDTAALVVGGTSNFALTTQKLITGLVAGESLTAVMRHRVAAGTGTWDYRTIHLQGIGS